MEPEMTDPTNRKAQPLDCRDCREGLQEYLDGTLEKQVSLRFFLHLRECADCRTEHDRLQELYEMLRVLPDHPVPAGFDEAILASVPYEAYRAMEPIRRERVPVYFEKEFLPAWIRSPITRLAGLGVTVVSLGVIALLDGPSTLAAAAVAGAIPEAVVQLQGLGRRVAIRQHRTES